MEENRELQTHRLPGIWAVVPIKRLAVAKQRLAAALGTLAKNSLSCWPAALSTCYAGRLFSRASSS